MTETSTQRPMQAGAWLGRQFPWQLFMLLNAALIFGVGGALYLLRAFTDPYEAVPLNGMTGGILAVVWGISLALAAAFFHSLRTHQERRQNPKLLALAVVLEALIFGGLTFRTFVYVPRSHITEERQMLGAYAADLSATLPAKINNSVTLDKVVFHGFALSFYYTLKEEKGFGYNKSTVHDIFLPQACSLFAEHHEEYALSAVMYFFSSDQEKFHLTFHRDGCAAPATAPTVLTPAPLAPSASAPATAAPASLAAPAAPETVPASGTPVPAPIAEPAAMPAPAEGAKP